MPPPDDRPTPLTEADVAALIDTLTNRIGENALYRFAPVASDVPERSIQRVAPMAPDESQSWPAHWPRPTRLLVHPERIETVALLPDHPPSPSPGGETGDGSNGPMGRSGCSENGGNAMPN